VVGRGGKLRTDTRTDMRTDKRTDSHARMSPKLTQVNAKCDVVMKLSVFRTQTDTHTHTHKPKPIHPCYTGCKQSTAPLKLIFGGRMSNVGATYATCGQVSISKQIKSKFKTTVLFWVWSFATIRPLPQLDQLLGLHMYMLQRVHASLAFMFPRCLFTIVSSEAVFPVFCETLVD